MRKLGVSLLLSLVSLASGWAQESQIGAEFRKEGEQIRESCSGFNFKAIGSCAYTLFTDHPLHIAAGSLAPQNGIGLGGALVTHWTPNETWRLNVDLDATASTNGSWRAGGYLTAIWIRRRGIVARPGGSGGGPSRLGPQEQPVFRVVAQTTSLNTLTYFGVGPDTRDTSRAYYGMRETIAGGNAVFPVIPRLNVSLIGEAYGRFVELRPSLGRSSPSIEQLYGPATAPGLLHQPAFAQFGQGIRIRPQFAGGFLRLNYFAGLQEFVAGDSVNSFRRFTADLSHQIPFYRSTRPLTSRDHNGPDDCAAGPTVHECPPVSRNREGSLELRFWLSESFVPSGHVVPFYFQPTLGGSDINGNLALASYQDYRFRAPNAMLLRARFEHSIWGPIGATFMIDEGKVATRRGDIDFSHLRHSYGAGLTLRAGGFPMIWLMFAWGGHEGTHTTGTINSALLGGSPRPSLF